MSTEKTTSYDLYERAQRDPRFRRIVDMLVAVMIQDKLAPDEVRDAAYIASIEFIRIHPSPIVVYRDGERLTSLDPDWIREQLEHERETEK